MLRDRSGGRICYDPDTSMGNSEGVLAGADEEGMLGRGGCRVDVRDPLKGSLIGDLNGIYRSSWGGGLGFRASVYCRWVLPDIHPQHRKTPSKPLES